MADIENYFTEECWAALEANNIALEKQRSKERSAAERIASGQVEEPGVYTREDFLNDDGYGDVSALSTKASDANCDWITVPSGAHACIGDDDNVEIGPEGNNAPQKDDVAQHHDMFHNIKTNPTAGDVESLVKYAKEVATLNFSNHSLTKIAIQAAMTDPTSQDRDNVIKMVGDTLTLKPIKEFVSGVNRGPNPAGDDVKIITDGIRKVANHTVGTLYRLLKGSIKGSWNAAKKVNQIAGGRLNNPSQFKSMDDTKNDITQEQILDEVMAHVGKKTTAKELQNAILDTFEEILKSQAKSNFYR